MYSMAMFEREPQILFIGDDAGSLPAEDSPEIEPEFNISEAQLIRITELVTGPDRDASRSFDRVGAMSLANYAFELADPSLRDDTGRLRLSWAQVRHTVYEDYGDFTRNEIKKELQAFRRAAGTDIPKPIKALWAIHGYDKLDPFFKKPHRKRLTELIVWRACFDRITTQAAEAEQINGV